MKQMIRVHLPNGDAIDMTPYFALSVPDKTIASEAMQNVAVRELMTVLYVAPSARLEVISVE